MIARVLVSFTVTALSRVSEPRLCILSQVEAHAVTEDVSFTAVPAKIPKASPLAVSNPMAVPSTGKISAASTLKKKMTEMALTLRTPGRLKTVEEFERRIQE